MAMQRSYKHLNLRSHRLILFIIFLFLNTFFLAYTVEAANINTPVNTVQPVITDSGGIIARGEIYGTVEKKDFLNYDDIKLELILETDGVQFINFRKQPDLTEIHRNKVVFKIINPDKYNVVEWSTGLHITDPSINEIRYTATISVNKSGVYEKIYNTPDVPIIVMHANGESKKDSDGDMLTDEEEIQMGNNPQNPDTNGNGILDHVDTDFSNRRNIEDISIDLRGTKTIVEEGEDIILTLSAINLITKPPINLQIILTIPSGMSVSSTEFIQSGSGQYTANFRVKSGGSKYITVRTKTQQQGTYIIHGKIIYYFEDNISTAKYNEINLPVIVNKKTIIENNKEANPEQQSKPVSGLSHFGIILGIITAYIHLKK